MRGGGLINESGAVKGVKVICGSVVNDLGSSQVFEEK